MFTQRDVEARSTLGDQTFFCRIPAFPKEASGAAWGRAIYLRDIEVIDLLEIGVAAIIVGTGALAANPIQATLGLDSSTDVLGGSSGFTAWNPGFAAITASGIKYATAQPGERRFGSTFGLSGTVNLNGTTSVVGVGTSFTTQLVVGNQIFVAGQLRTVSVISSNTALTVTVAFSGTSTGNQAYGVRIGPFAQTAAAGGSGESNVTRRGMWLRLRGANGALSTGNIVKGHAWCRYRAYRSGEIPPVV